MEFSYMGRDGSDGRGNGRGSGRGDGRGRGRGDGRGRGRGDGRGHYIHIKVVSLTLKYSERIFPKDKFKSQGIPHILSNSREDIQIKVFLDPTAEGTVSIVQINGFFYDTVSWAAFLTEQWFRMYFEKINNKVALSE